MIAVTTARSARRPARAPTGRLIVLAKAPAAGRSKTRLSPPYTPAEAAALAEAALGDTLDAVLRTPAREHVLVLEGAAGPWLPAGFRVVGQRGDGLDERIAAAFADAGGPALLIGMDTPQVTPAALSDGLETLDAPGIDAVLGTAADGGWWAMGLRRPDPAAVVGVPMGTSGTAAAQRTRLAALGLRVGELPDLRDVDGVDDAATVARTIPNSRFSQVLASAARAHGRSPAVTVGILGSVGLLLVVANRVADLLRRSGVRLRLYAPPLVGKFDARWTVRIAVAAVVGAGVAWFGPAVAARLRWRHLLVISQGAAMAWALALAWQQGVGGITGPVTARAEYLHDVGLVGSPGPFLAGFVDRIDIYTTHVRAHPPGYLLLLWTLSRAGLGGPVSIGLLQMAAAAAAVPAVLVAAREVAGEHVARLAAPFLVLTPAAVFFGSGDAAFLGLGAWAVALVVLATGRSDRAGDLRAFTGGLLLGAACLLSYGLVLLAVIPAAVAFSRRRARPVLIAGLGAVVLPMTAAASGFWWFAGFAATRGEYLESVARLRPAWLFVWLNLAAFAVALGPAAVVGLARLRDRRTWLLVGAAALAVALADVSLLSKGEVERIWLPFAPWILVATVALGARRNRRGWLAAQAALALTIQVLVVSPW